MQENFSDVVDEIQNLKEKIQLVEGPGSVAKKDCSGYREKGCKSQKQSVGPMGHAGRKEKLKMDKRGSKPNMRAKDMDRPGPLGDNQPNIV